MSRNYIVVDEEGVPCPRCGGITQVRVHKAITPKIRKQPYYFRKWYYCPYPRCKVNAHMAEEFKVWNDNDAADSLRKLQDKQRERFEQTNYKTDLVMEVLSEPPWD